MTDMLRELDDKIAALFSEGSPISADAEPLPPPSLDQPTTDEALFEGQRNGNGRTICNHVRATKLTASRIGYRDGDPSPLGAARYQSQANKIVAYQPG